MNRLHFFRWKRLEKSDMLDAGIVDENVIEPKRPTVCLIMS